LGRPKAKYCLNGHERTPDNVYKHRACKTCAKSKTYTDAEKAARIERSKKWHRDNPDKVRATEKRYRDRNPGKRRELSAFRRLKKHLNKGYLPKHYFQILYAQQMAHCAYCGCDLNTAKVHLDHIIPLSKDGNHEWSNLCLSCAPCNQRKGDRCL